MIGMLYLLMVSFKLVVFMSMSENRKQENNKKASYR